MVKNILVLRHRLLLFTTRRVRVLNPWNTEEESMGYLLSVSQGRAGQLQEHFIKIRLPKRDVFDFALRREDTDDGIKIKCLMFRVGLYLKRNDPSSVGLAQVIGGINGNELPMVNNSQAVT